MFQNDIQVWVDLDDLDALSLKTVLTTNGLLLKVSGCKRCAMCMLSKDIVNRYIYAYLYFFYLNQQILRWLAFGVFWCFWFSVFRYQ